jgi:UDP-N-acetylglucosamine transferase subunit ALG13
MIFVTVGTQFPFDRLIEAVDRAVEAGRITDEVFAQTGEAAYTPRHFPAEPSLEKDAFDEYVRRATGIISHAGIGSMTMAMAWSKPMLVMPRLARYGEVVNDHQVAIARQFSKSGYVLFAADERELLEKVIELPFFVPRPRIAQREAVSRRVVEFLNELTV